MFSRGTSLYVGHGSKQEVFWHVPFMHVSQAPLHCEEVVQATLPQQKAGTIAQMLVPGQSELLLQKF